MRDLNVERSRSKETPHQFVTTCRDGNTTPQPTNHQQGRGVVDCRDRLTNDKNLKALPCPVQFTCSPPPFLPKVCTLKRASPATSSHEPMFQYIPSRPLFYSVNAPDNSWNIGRVMPRISEMPLRAAAHTVVSVVYSSF
jgi:hypothetical protein